MVVCAHSQTEYGRVVFAGGGYHIIEYCLACRANVRGPGVWVPRAELDLNLDHLNVYSDRRSSEEKGEQKTLF